MAAATPQQLYEPCPHCGDHHPQSAEEVPGSIKRKINKEIARVVREVFNGSDKLTDTRLLSVTGSLLESNVLKGYGRDFSGADFTTPDANMLTRITRNTWEFAAARNYQELRDFTLALKDADGKLRSFNDFKEACNVTDDKYGRWLNTEYNQAIGAATMASRWQEFTANADDMPYLRYSTVGDDNVRDSHALLDGVVKKITDQFWNTHFPPNGWGCRCDVEQMATSFAKETEDVPSVPVPAMFKTNLAKTGLIYPKGHPYYDGVSNDVMRRAVASLPDNVAYKNVYTAETGGGYVDVHIYHGTQEMAENIKTAKILADKGYKVKLLPVLGKADDDLREVLYKTKNFVKGKNPDALLNNQLIVDFKNARSAGRSAIQNGIEYAQAQVDIAVIRLPEGLDNNFIERVVKGKMKQAKWIKETWVINDGDLTGYTLEGFGLPPKAKRPDK